MSNRKLNQSQIYFRWIIVLALTSVMGVLLIFTVILHDVFHSDADNTPFLVGFSFAFLIVHLCILYSLMPGQSISDLIQKIAAMRKKMMAMLFIATILFIAYLLLHHVPLQAKSILSLSVLSTFWVIQFLENLIYFAPLAKFAQDPDDESSRTHVAIRNLCDDAENTESGAKNGKMTGDDIQDMKRVEPC